MQKVEVDLDVAVVSAPVASAPVAVVRTSGDVAETGRDWALTFPT